MNKSAQGIGGWLKFYIVCSLYITPILSVLGFLLVIEAFKFILPELAKNNPTPTTYLFVSGIVQFVLVAWRIIACLKLKEQWVKKSVDGIKLFLFISPVASFLSDLVFGQINFNFLYFVIYLTFLLMEPVTWYWYFSTSERVKQTYLKPSVIKPL